MSVVSDGSVSEGAAAVSADPVFGALFDRFLAEGLPSMPDIDGNFDRSYLNHGFFDERYGSGVVSNE